MSTTTNTSGVGSESSPIDNSNAPTNAAPSLVDQLAGSIKETVGGLVGNHVTQEEGTIQKTEGSGAKGGLSEGIAGDLKAAQAAAANKNA